MRTVTFSDPEVAREVNSKFVPVWINRAPGFHNCEKHTEQRIFEQSQEAYATRNICTFFMTADEKVAHYVAGYYSPSLFLEALRFVDGMKGKLADADAVRRHHALFAQICRDEAAAILDASKPTADPKDVEALLRKYGAFKYEARHQHGPQCLHSLGEAIEYWARLHEEFAERRTLPSFDDVKRGYKFGNGFSEEPPRTPPDDKDTPTGDDRKPTETEDGRGKRR